MPFPLGALLTGGGSVIGGLLGRSGQSSANKANLRIARENREFQERMSSTAYQRATKDLEASGLNRILAIGSPSSTPAGNIATMLNEQKPLQEGIQSGISSAIMAATATANIKLTNARTAFTEAQTNVIKPAAGVGEGLGGIIETGKTRIQEISDAFGRNIAKPSTALQNRQLIESKKTPMPKFENNYSKTVNQMVVKWYDRYMEIVGEKPTEQMIRDKYQEFAKTHRKTN